MFNKKQKNGLKRLANQRLIFINVLSVQYIMMPAIFYIAWS